MKLWVEDTRRRRLSLSQESGLELRKVNLPKAPLSLGRPDSRGHRGVLETWGIWGRQFPPCLSLATHQESHPGLGVLRWG